jgi:hypothetical protein
MPAYFTPPQPKVQNTPWKGNTKQEVAFDRAFIIKVVCAWCKCHLSGPVDAPKISHGMCKACKDEQMRGLE